jgi:hypothetical protein
MSHWAELDENNIVIRVIVGNDNDPDEGYQWIINNLGGRWVKTSYNTRDGVYYKPGTEEPDEDQSKVFRGTYAGEGMYYDEDEDIFTFTIPSEKVE